jgi:hypothetical protein
MKTSYYSILKSLIYVVIGILFGPGLIQFAIASPVGTAYEAYLEIPVLVQPGIESNYEEGVPFDGVPVVFPNDVGPGKDLWITEDYSRDAASGREDISITISSGDGTSLTINAIDEDGFSILELAFYGSYWENMWADAVAELSKIEFDIAVLFPGETEFNSVDFIPIEPAGDGTPDFPLILPFEIPAGELIGIDGDDIVNASDMRLEITVQPVPIPGTLLLMISGLIGIFAIKRKSYAGNGNHG